MAGVEEGIKNADESNNSELDHTAPTSYKIMTINMNGKSAGKGTAERRRNSLCRILRENPCDIIFCQEPPDCFEKVVKEVDKSINYNGQAKAVRTGEKSAVIWSTKYFNDCTEGYRTTDTRIREIHENTIKSANTGSEILTRISMVKLTVKNSTETILAVSFHGPKNKTSLKDRKRVFGSLLQFIQDVVKENNIHSYIIGGDFNFDTSKQMNLPTNVRVGKRNKLTDREERKKQGSSNFIPYKDTFVYCPTTILTVDEIQALDIESIVGDELRDLFEAMHISDDKKKEIKQGKAQKGQQSMNVEEEAGKVKEVGEVNSEKKDKDKDKAVCEDFKGNMTQREPTRDNAAKEENRSVKDSSKTGKIEILDHDPVLGQLHIRPPNNQARVSDDNENERKEDSVKRLDKDKKPKVKIHVGKKTKSTETRKAHGQNKDEAVNKEDVTEKTSRGKLAIEKAVKERNKSLDHSSKIVKQERDTVTSTGKATAAKSRDVKRISRPIQSSGFQDGNTAKREETAIADSKLKSSQKPERKARPQK